MAQTAGSSSQEYWRPPKPEAMRLVGPAPSTTPCWRCGADYPPGAFFCHICGSEREPGVAPPATEPKTSSNLAEVRRRRVGLSVPCVVFFVLGVTCMIGAALTGIVYKVDTLVDWQAVQIWRIEWLLAASAALLAGILLQRNE